MTVNATMRTELASLQPTSLIELFVLETLSGSGAVCDIYRFHAGVNNKTVPGYLVWNGEAYQAWPVSAEGFEYTGKGTLPRPKFTIANVEGAISQEIAVFNETDSFSAIYQRDFVGSRITRIRTLARFIDAVNFEGNTNPFGTPDPTIRMPDEIYYIDRKAVENREYVQFELVSSLDLQGVRVPKRAVLKNSCSWIYKGEGCNYAGTDYFDENDFRVNSESLDVCGKQLSSCQKRFGRNQELPFGGFPGAGPYSQ
jgi:lambda family phage minor tail protein L